MKPAEIILIDDGSTDQTATIAKAYDEVTYVYQANSGLSQARNSGLSLCTTSYILFLDADDVLTEDAVEVLLACIEANPSSAFVSGSFSRIDENGGSTIFWKIPEPLSDNLYHALLLENYIAMPGTVLYQTKILTKFGGFDVSYNSAEDYDTYLRISSEYPIKYTNQKVGLYRTVSNSMSSNGVRMLNTTIRAIDAQKASAKLDADAIKAYHSGRKSLQRRYCRKIALNSVTHALSGDLKKAKDSFLFIANYSITLFFRSYFWVIYKGLSRGFRRLVWKN